MQEVQDLGKEASTQQRTYQQSQDMLTALQERMRQTEQLLSTCVSTEDSTAQKACNLEYQLQAARWVHLYILTDVQSAAAIAQMVSHL